jgi:glycosyltransferase involved in cell wall biosynthesis
MGKSSFCHKTMSDLDASISVIICTHNPRPEYLRLVLDALKAQTFTRERWELLLIDNASTKPLEQQWDISWHPHARHVREEQMGVIHARLRGIGEAKGELIVFIDDDNVAAPDYLAQALELANTWPTLGVWGGQITGSFEEPPANWMQPILGNLALRNLTKDVWSNSKYAFDAMPWGAGMVARVCVCRYYKEKAHTDPVRLLLGRKGRDLASGEDADLAYTAIDAGFGFGVFRALKLTHLIPKSRLTEDYVVRLVQSMSCSMSLLCALHQQSQTSEAIPKSGFARLSELLRDSHQRKLFFARRRGKKLAAKLLAGQPNGRRQNNSC